LKSAAELQAELNSFQSVWPGGFFEGDPANPAFGLWAITSFIGVSHAIYLSCIKPYVKADTTVLEIGCGRGAWTKLMLDAREIYCLDAQPPEHTRFFEYIGHHERIHYVTVSDFSMKDVPLDAIDFVFSYDALCHVSFAGINEYARNLFTRMRPGAHGFWMVADYQKYNQFVADQDRYNVLRSLLPRQKHPLFGAGLNWFFRRINRWNAKRYHLRALDLNEDDLARPGRWYHAGLQRTCEMLKRNGFTIVQADQGLDYRSPLIHFCK
jgi:hypothetical protein